MPPPGVSPEPDWSVVIPYYNEREYLPATLQSLLAQTVSRFTLFLVDNASSDGTRAAIEPACQALAARGVEVVHLHEGTPGQVHALKKGLGQARTRYVATCDADTFYPPAYLATAGRLFEEGGEGVVAVMAAGVRSDANALAGWAARLKSTLVGALLARQCHAGGFAHAFRTEALRAAGGYDEALWPFVLYDHELMQRVLKLGASRYALSHWCGASSRRTVHTNTRWTLLERILYHATPFALKDWFFYTFLAGRFRARGLGGVNIRIKPWQTASADG